MLSVVVCTVIFSLLCCVVSFSVVVTGLFVSGLDCAKIIGLESPIVVNVLKVGLPDIDSELDNGLVDPNEFVESDTLLLSIVEGVLSVELGSVGLEELKELVIPNLFSKPVDELKDCVTVSFTVDTIFSVVVDESLKLKKH